MRRLLLLLLIALAWPRPAPADDAYVLSSDGIRLHYTVTGPPNAKTIVFIPGWTMPAWIFAPQIAYFSQTYRVIAFDPRGQGGSQIASTGYNPARRGADIADLLAQLGPRPVVIVGWSLGVLDTLAYIHQDGDARIAGLVLIDNSVGENPPPLPQRWRPGPVLSHAAYMRAFVAHMFRTYQTPAYLNRLTAATLVTPACDAAALLRYPVPRSYWRAAIFATDKPVLYVVRPGLRGQAENLLKDRPDTEIAIFGDAGHALFVDDASRFDALMARFLAQRVWP
jgi:microsomal epoxide hydrolase